MQNFANTQKECGSGHCESKYPLPSITISPAFVPFPKDEGRCRRGINTILPTPLLQPTEGFGHPQKYTFLWISLKSLFQSELPAVREVNT